MASKDHRSAALRARSSVHGQVRKQEHNNPVPVEEFDRERMGIAAKE
jgi:hypothetical protein